MLLLGLACVGCDDPIQTGTRGPAVTAPDASRDGAEDDYRIALPGVRRIIQPKTPGQAAYLKSIADHDIVIGIGPAGTGKTYLAVAIHLGSPEEYLRSQRIEEWRKETLAIGKNPSVFVLNANLS